MAHPTSHWLKFCNSIEGKNSTRQLAAGVVLGMLIGLLPKDSLLIVAATVVLILSPANLLTGGLSAILFSWIALQPPCESWMNSLGMRVLGQPAVEQLFREWWTYSLIPWTRINNSLVIGSLVLWGILMLPVYWAASVLFTRFGDRMYDLARDSRILSWLIGSRKPGLKEGQA